MTFLVLTMLGCETPRAAVQDVLAEQAPRTVKAEQCVTEHDGLACAHLAEWYDKGTHGPVIEDQARVFYEKACDAEVFGACVRLGLMRTDGRGGPKDIDGALDVNMRACRGSLTINGASGCTNAGVHLLANNDISAMELLRDGCTLRSRLACRILTDQYMGVGYKGAEPLVVPDFRAAEPYAQQLCKLEDGEGCYIAARLAQRNGAPKAGSDALFARGCELGHQPACSPPPPPK
jgi:TPR repeat protein